MSTGNVDIHHSVYKYVVSLRAGFCVTVPNVGLMYVERNKCLSVQNDLGTNTSYIKVSYDNKAAYYSDSECKEFSRNVPYDFYACIQPELSINSFYFNNKMYVLTNRRDAPSAQLMTTNYLHPRCTFYYGRRINSFVENGYVHAKANKLVGTDIYLDIPSVGATENLMLASILAEGSTRIQNAAQEPEIVDLANFLNTMGADVVGAGTSEIVINGVKQEDLHPIEYTTIPDRIEAGTFMSAVVGTRGKAIIRNVYPAHLTFFTDKLIKMGANIKLIEPTAIEVSCKNRLNSVNFVTQPYPGFPTDLQSMAMVLLSTANGVGIITESLYENRFMQVQHLLRMGADIHQDRNHAIIKGVKKLTGATVEASDLRAGASLVVAGLMADGTTIVEKLHHIDRGYEKFDEKIRNLGGNIIRYNDGTPSEETRIHTNESRL